MPGSIFLPAAVLALWTILNVLRLAHMRVSALRSREVPLEYYTTYDGPSPESDKLKKAGRHVQNLFEAPTLFYAAVIVAHLAATADGLMLGLAWAYVALRVVHSFIHLGSNNVTHRFYLYASSMAVLGIIWALIAIRLI